MHPVAEQIFFDRKDLPAGGDYNTKIRTAIEESDLIIFLVSSSSIKKGAYARTELKFASEKWPSPIGHVLPVPIEQIDVKTIPNYLKAVTVTEFHGNIPAEVASIVARQYKRLRIPRIAKISLSIASIVGISLLFVYINSQQSPELRPIKDNYADEFRPFYEQFHGDLSYLFRLESPTTTLIVSNPRNGGIVLPPGLDLAFQKWLTIEKLYGNHLAPEELDALKKVTGLKGQDALDALKNNPVLRNLTVPEEVSRKVWPYSVRTYWDRVSSRFPTLLNEDTPCSIQTVLLGLAYNRGYDNRALEALRQPLEDREWKQVAEIVGEMQQDHKLEYVRQRRRAEAEFISKELGWWSPWGEESCNDAKFGDNS